MRRALTIAGSDSGGGAGIQADLKTFAALGVHGMSAITSVTAQNTLEVRAMHDLPPAMVRAQIESVVEDIGLDAAKTGMLSSARIISAVAQTVERYDFPLVVDPLMVAENGARLLREDAVHALVEGLLPLARVVTPNRHEAEWLSGMPIKTKQDAQRAARIIKKMGADAVIITGGHIGRSATDILYYNNRFVEFKGKRMDGCTHGTGCSFSAAVTANLAKGHDLLEAVEQAKQLVTTAIRYGGDIGGGPCPVNPTAWLERDAERWRVYHGVSTAVARLYSMDITPHIPEVGMNIAYALPLPYMGGSEDVAAVDGRITRGVGGPRAGTVAFGASRHLAQAVAAMMKHDASARAVMNIKYDKKLLAGRAKQLVISFYDRREEPESVRKKEGATVPWGIDAAVKKAGKPPDVIYHEGDRGKEPMILIFGRDPEDVLRKFGILTGKKGTGRYRKKHR